MIISTTIPAQSCRRCRRRRGDRRQSAATARATASTLALAATAAAMTMLSFAPVAQSFATTTTTVARGGGIPPRPSVAPSTSTWAIGAASASSFTGADRRRSETTCPGGSGSTCRGYANYVDDARSLDNEEHTSSFERRMREQFMKNASPPTSTSRGEQGDAATATMMPSNVCTAETLEQYKAAVGDEKERLVAVRFHATWCRSCKAIAPAFYRLARRHPDVRFVEVPVTQHNAMLHQGLGVPSVPFGHIYHPAAGLVEEMRISKGGMSDFASVLGTYVDGQCQFPAAGDCSNPYE